MYTSMAKETKTTVAKVKPTDPGGSSKGKIDSSINRKKIESSNKQYVDYKQKSVLTITKSEVKSKTTSASIKTTTTKTTTKVREKKVYTLPGQKYDIPEEFLFVSYLQREPLRIFYESLSKQIPSSEMAEFWLMEHGILSPERSKKAYEKKQRKQKELRMGTPVKASSKPESSHRQQQLSKNGNVNAKKRITNESDNDDFILSPKRRKG